MHSNSENKDDVGDCKTLNVNLIRTEAGCHKREINLSLCDKFSFLR